MVLTGTHHWLMLFPSITLSSGYFSREHCVASQLKSIFFLGTLISVRWGIKKNEKKIILASPAREGGKNITYNIVYSSSSMLLFLMTMTHHRCLRTLANPRRFSTCHAWAPSALLPLTKHKFYYIVRSNEKCRHKQAAYFTTWHNQQGAISSTLAKRSVRKGKKSRLNT